MKKREPSVYVRLNGDGTYYVGQSGNGAIGRYHTTKHIIVEFLAPIDRKGRILTETEMIHFCEAIGLPITNVLQRNRKETTE